MEMNPGLKNINLSYGNLEIFRDFNIEFQEGEINCILGPSGCGKTSLLNIIAGLLKPDNISENGFKDKAISYVFQDPRLLPWMTVGDNIRFVLRDRFDSPIINETIDEYLEMVQLTAFKDYYPAKLSGGMRQRVSLARAFSFPSEVILMDEPFKGLDLKLKEELSLAFQTLYDHRKVSVIWVSHDVEEALRPGRYTTILNGSPVKIAANFFTNSENIKTNRVKTIELLGK